MIIRFIIIVVFTIFRVFMKKILIIILLVLLKLSIWSQEIQTKTAQMFIINLCSITIDIKLGENNSVFYAQEINPFESSDNIQIKDFGDYHLYFKSSSSEEWHLWLNKEGHPLKYEIKQNMNYCIIIGLNGSMNFYVIEDDLKDGAKACFLNGANLNIPRMEISKKWNENVAAFIEDINENQISNYITIDSGEYSFFWQLPDQKDNSEYFYFPDSTGNHQKFNFVKGNYYLFLTLVIDDSSYAILYNITPKTNTIVEENRYYIKLINTSLKYSFLKTNQ